MVSDIVLPTLIQMLATKVADSNPKKIGFNTMNGNVFRLKWLGMWILVAGFKVGLLFFDPFKIAGWPLLLGLMVNKPGLCAFPWEDGFREEFYPTEVHHVWVGSGKYPQTLLLIIIFLHQTCWGIPPWPFTELDVQCSGIFNCKKGCQVVKIELAVHSCRCSQIYQ